MDVCNKQEKPEVKEKVPPKAVHPSPALGAAEHSAAQPSRTARALQQLKCHSVPSVQTNPNPAPLTQILQSISSIKISILQLLQFALLLF